MRTRMEAFRDVISICQLEDLGFLEPKFTWCSKREGEDFIKERLDRALANHQWQDLYPVRQVEIMSSCSSDHSPIHVQFQKRTDRRRRMKPKF